MSNNKTRNIITHVFAINTLKYCFKFMVDLNELTYKYTHVHVHSFAVTK